MQIGMDVSIRQTQKLALTPQMEQSLSVLQMGTEELNQCIEEEVLSNPMLEYAKPEEKKGIRQSYGEGIGYYSRRKSEDEDYQSYLNAIADEKSCDTGLKEYLREKDMKIIGIVARSYWNKDNQSILQFYEKVRTAFSRYDNVALIGIMPTDGDIPVQLYLQKRSHYL